MAFNIVTFVKRGNGVGTMERPITSPALFWVLKLDIFKFIHLLFYSFSALTSKLYEGSSILNSGSFRFLNVAGSESYNDT